MIGAAQPESIAQSVNANPSIVVVFSGSSSAGSMALRRKEVHAE
jgi:hypothetical protein